MQQENLIRLEVQVLEGSCPEPGDELFSDTAQQVVRWCRGQRWRFSLGLLAARPDLLVLDHAGLARLLCLVPRPLRQRYALFVHGVEIWNSARADYHRAARKAALLIANSNDTARKVAEHCPDHPRIEVCWPGRDPLVPGIPAENLSLDNIGPHAMLIVGRLAAEQRHKGHDQLIEVMPLVLQAVPDAQLVIAGSGDDRQRLEARTLELGVADSVVFTGWADEAQLSDLYSRCALFVMPSKGDGFGLVFLEAMAHRRPCVGLQGGAAAEIFEDGLSGVLVDRDDRSGMAETLSGLLLDEPRRQRIGQAGYERYQGMFTDKHYAARLRAVLLKIVSAPRQTGNVDPGKC